MYIYIYTCIFIHKAICDSYLPIYMYIDFFGKEERELIYKYIRIYILKKIYIYIYVYIIRI
jgi:hypothetical protein